jgi:hypothetical protein
MDTGQPNITDQPGSSRETMFLVTFQNQINLIHIADNKANMIISINSIIISIIVSVTGLGALSQSVELSKKYILFPVTFIIITSLISVVFAIQAAKPQIRKQTGLIRRKDAEKTSLLFFGAMSGMTLNEYLDEMDNVLESKNSIKEQLVIDIFNQGKVLSRKYGLLNYAYQIFMYGFIFSVVTFLIMLLI